MHIITGTPPNFEAIKLVFPMAADKGVLFCYDDTIFNPSGDYIAPSLIAHEEVHEKQQREIGVTTWWDRYLDTPQFRYRQELEAHIVEYHDFIKRNKSREMRREYLTAIGKRLTGPLYGNTGTLAEAITSIQRGQNVRRA